jgi:hypothetical protein
MATNRQTIDMAAQVADNSERLRALELELKDTLDVNSVRAIDWSTKWQDFGLASADSLFSEIPEWPAGVNGDFSFNDVSNGLFSLDQVILLLSGQAVTVGDHGGNLTKLTTSKRKTILLRVADQSNV